MIYKNALSKVDNVMKMFWRFLMSIVSRLCSVTLSQMISQTLWWNIMNDNKNYLIRIINHILLCIKCVCHDWCSFCFIFAPTMFGSVIQLMMMMLYIAIFLFQSFGNSQREYDKAVVNFSVKNQLRYKGSLGNCIFVSLSLASLCLCITT